MVLEQMDALMKTLVRQAANQQVLQQLGLSPCPPYPFLSLRARAFVCCPQLNAAHPTYTRLSNAE